MKYIFVDNFRGFKETLLPLKDVNFMVGENSTGKTSLLRLLHVFDSPSFWISGQFSVEDTGYGNYDDIVSMHAMDKKSFSVGAMYTPVVEKEENGFELFLMTFSKKEGMPRIKRYTLVIEGESIDIKFTGNKVMYRLSKLELTDFEYNNIKDVFLKLTNSQRIDEPGFKELKRIGRGRSNIALINSFIKAMMKKEQVPRNNISFSWPSIYRSLNWIAPIRIKPQDIYTKAEVSHSPEGHHTPYSIRKLLESRTAAKEFREFVETFGDESGLFDSVKIRKYGNQKTSPFELDIVMSGKQTNITNVGYGVSQVLPIIVEIFLGIKNTAYAIQQPEIHLHPKAQAALGDVIFKLANLENKKFFIETHSEYIIDRFRMNYKKSKKDKPQSQIVYFENNEEGNKAYIIDIQDNGDLPSEQPPGFRDFFIREEMSILGL